MSSKAFKRFQTECEILRIRHDKTTGNIIKIDEEVGNVIDKSNISEEARIQLKERWQFCLNTDVKRIDEKCRKKMLSTTAAFEKDKKSLAEKEQGSRNMESLDISSDINPGTSKKASPKVDVSPNTECSSIGFSNHGYSHACFSNTENEEVYIEVKEKHGESKNGMSPTSPNKHKYKLRSSICPKDD